MKVYALRDESLKFYPDNFTIPIDAVAVSVHVPLADCPVCERGWGSSVRYPFFRPDKDGSSQLRKLWRRRNDHDVIPRDPAKFWLWLAEFRQAMTQECPRATLINPSADFGPLRLVVNREVDLAKVGCGVQLVARASIVEHLKGQGLQLQPCLTLVRPPKNRSSDEYLENYDSGRTIKAPAEPYLELFAAPAARKADSFPGQACPKCLRFQKDWDWSEPLPITASSVPQDADLFRVWERPGAILATERFVQAVAGLNTWEIEWQPVELSD